MKKRKKKKKNDLTKNSIVLILFILLTLFTMFWKTDQTENKVSSTLSTVISSDSSLIIDYFDVGQGDCTLIRCGDEAMLIDAGDNSKGTAVQRYLTEAGVTELKYCICSHPDSDHIGGMDVIITKFDVETVIMTEKENDTATYRDVISAIEYRNVNVIHPQVGEVYSLGGAEFMICGPTEDYDDTNNTSIVVYLYYGETAFLWNGDAGTKAESDMMDAGMVFSADVMMAGHHGSRTSTSREYLEMVDPKYIIISCGLDNEYGHPHKETLDLIEEKGIELYRTDIDGTIEIISTGNDIWISSK